MGNIIFRAVLAAVVGYFCGCFNGSVIVSKYILHDDVRTHGSGNAGLTNFYRTFGGPLTAVVILTDVLKAVVGMKTGALLFSGIQGGELVLYAEYWAAGWVLLGHMYPCMFHFRGGKGVLSGGTMVLLLDWRIAAVVWIGFLVLVLLTRYISLGSIWAGASFPFATWFVYRDPILFGMGLFLGGLVVWKHRSNIHRLLTGTENRFSFHRKN